MHCKNGGVYSPHKGWFTSGKLSAHGYRVELLGERLAYYHYLLSLVSQFVGFIRKTGMIKNERIHLVIKKPLIPFLSGCDLDYRL